MSGSLWICQHCGKTHYTGMYTYHTTDIEMCDNCFLDIKQAMQSPQIYNLTAISFLKMNEYIYISCPMQDQEGKKFWLIQLAKIIAIQNQSHVVYSFLNKDKTPNKQQQFVFSGSDIARIEDMDCITLKNGNEIRKVDKTRELKDAPSIPVYSNMYFRCDWQKPFNNKLDLLCHGYSKRIYSERIASCIIDIICNMFYCHFVKAFNCPLFYWYDLQSDWYHPQSGPKFDAPKIYLELFSSFINLRHIRSEKDVILCKELGALNENELELYPSWWDDDIHCCFEAVIVKHENINLDAIPRIDKKLITYFLDEIKRNKKLIETEVGVCFDWCTNMDLDNIDVKILDLNAESMSNIKWLRHHDFFQKYQSYNEDWEMFMTENDIKKNCKIKVKQIVNDKIKPFFCTYFKDNKVIVIDDETVLTVLILGVTQEGDLAGYTGHCEDY